jgi:hypothetical protein
MTTGPSTTPKPRRRWFQDTPLLFRRPLGLPVFETLFVLAFGTGVLLALLLPVIQWILELVR